METVFLTGATGFVGSHVAVALLDAGHRVRALVRGDASRLPAGVEPVPGDVRTAGDLVGPLTGCRWLVHTAALYSFAPADRPMMRAVNVDGTDGLLEAARIAGVESAVVTSSSATTSGHADGSAYHASKVEQERAALAAPLPTVLVLPTAPVGPGDRRPTPTGRMVLDVMRGRMVVYPPGRMNVVAVEDVAAAHVLALERGRPGRKYVVGDRDLDLRDVFAIAARAAGRPAPSRPLPVRLALVAAAADEARCRARLGREPLVPLEGVRMSMLDMSADSGLARDELGWRPRFDGGEALERAVRWYRAAGLAG